MLLLKSNSMFKCSYFSIILHILLYNKYYVVIITMKIIKITLADDNKLKRANCLTFDFFLPLPFLFTHLVLIETLIITVVVDVWTLNINFSVFKMFSNFHNWKMLHVIKSGNHLVSASWMCISEIKSYFAKSYSRDLNVKRQLIETVKFIPNYGKTKLSKWIEREQR